MASKPVRAQEDLRAIIFNEIVDALNKETHEIYNDYINIVDELENEDENTLVRFYNKLPVWKSIFDETRPVFNKYKSSGDTQISEISNLALQANNKAVSAIDLYVKGFNSETDTEIDRFLSSADEAFIDSSNIHFKAVDLYNEYSGYSSSMSARNWLIFFSVASVILTLIFFAKSRSKSKLEAEMIRSEVYKSLFSSSAWMTVGIVITTAGYSYALKEGGSYYILYGPVIFGGWQLLKGLTNYLTKGRKTLAYLNSLEKNNAIRESYSNHLKTEKTPEYVCRFCGAKNSRKGVICRNCGENIL